MSHDLFSSLDAFISLPAAAPLFVCEEEGSYRPATHAELLRAAQRVLAGQLRGTDALSSPMLVRDFLRLRLGALAHEVFAVIHLDQHHRVLDYVEMFRGSLAQTSVYPREVLKDVLVRNSAAVVFVHNHPSGEAKPSQADEILTQMLSSALAFIDVRVVDHMVVTSGAIMSMAELGLL